jgi:SAM-dependent methyltransferase
MLLYSLTIFLSAFLLFEVQPIIAKMILPWFGGTSAVWSTCMLFFQLVLLLGYLYAHWLHRTFRPRRQAIVHIAVLAVSFAALPILPNPYWKSGAVAQPSLRILALLAVTVGLPYFLLSSTSPLLQAWYARNHKEGLPYRLFALSNFASMLALLSYPLLVEPNLPNRMQAWIWSGVYIAFAAVCALTGWRSANHPAAALDGPAANAAAAGPAPSWPLRFLWLGLAAAASVLLLAVTNHLTQDVAAIPFLWILPLTLYLLTFILCFEAPRLYLRPVFLPLVAIALAFMAFELWPGRNDVDIYWVGQLARLSLRIVIPAMAASLFVCCMACHGELARLKPHPRYLTGFYVTVSLGGAVGGLFVGLLAPNLFRAYYEFPVGLALCLLMVTLVLARALASYRGALRLAGTAALVLVLAGYLWCLTAIMRTMVTGYRVVARNFYGLLRVYDSGDPRFEEDAARKLVHGVINHGEQMLREEYRRMPVTYFCPQSGIGRVMRALEGHPRKIGILGLGCGTLAAYGRPGDTLRIYEINPLVLDIARSEFSYLTDTPAKVEVATGDGRLVLESEPDQQFDLLVMDAFSGDSVPVHLITREAFQMYFRHLKPGGILAVNISNKYLNLEPVMERASNAFGKLGLVYHYEPGEAEEFCFSCSWTLIMNPATADVHPELLTRTKVLRPQRPFRIWTDDFSNMFSILK